MKGKTFLIEFNLFTELIDAAKLLEIAYNKHRIGIIDMLDEEGIPFKINKNGMPILDIDDIKYKPHVLKYEHPELTKIIEEIGIIKNITEHYPDEEYLQADGFDDAILGVVNDFNSVPRLAYSTKLCIDILMKQSMNYEEAVEYFDFNVKGAYMGEKTPIWVDDMI